ncbi:MAG: hypothetical protein Q9217_002843 [Psora testacea]
MATENENVPPPEVDGVATGISSATFSDLNDDVLTEIVDCMILPRHLYPRPGPDTRYQARIAFVPESVENLLLKMIGPLLSNEQADRHAPNKPLGEIRNGLALIFVNKRVSRLASRVFYATNLFNIPPGPWRSSMAYFRRLPTQNRMVIRHVSLRIGLRDLTPAILDDIGTEIARLRLGNPREMTSGQKASYARTFGVVAANHVSNV